MGMETLVFRTNPYLVGCRPCLTPIAGSSPIPVGVQQQSLPGCDAMNIKGVRAEWHFLKRNILNLWEKKGWSGGKLIATKQLATTDEANPHES